MYWWTSARWLANLTTKVLRPAWWNRTVSANSLENHVQKTCWQFDGWTQITSIWQIVRLYRVSERPNTGPKGHKQARKTKTRPKGTKGDKWAIFSHVFFSRTHAWLSRVASHATVNLSTPLYMEEGTYLVCRKTCISMEEDSYAYLSKGRQGKTPKRPKMLKQELYLFIFYIVLSTNYSAVFAYKERQNSIYKQLNILTPIRELAFLFRSPDNSYWTICSSAKP